MSIVLDSSMALTWCLPGQANSLSLAILERIQQGGALVPAIWHLEMANILGLKHRSGNLSLADLKNAVILLRSLSITTDETSRQATFEDLLPMLEQYRLTIYDASYLEVARLSGLPLATFDKALIEAARQHGVALTT